MYLTGTYRCRTDNFFFLSLRILRKENTVIKWFMAFIKSSTIFFIYIYKRYLIDTYMCRTDLFLFCFIFYFTLCTLGKQSYIVIHSIFNHILFFIYKKMYLNGYYLYVPDRIVFIFFLICILRCVR